MTSEGDAAISENARTVLADNRVGEYTKPAPGLYPHQWSWDSAFIAIGLATYDIERARTELASAFRGQWRNGMLPQITYEPGAAGYFPGPNLWQIHRSPNAPVGHETSGITQHPLHAVAAWLVHSRAADEASVGWLHEIYPALMRWHTYLHRERDPESTGLAAVRHPWETWDNSPVWDEVLATMEPPAELDDITRPDRTHVDAGQRPDDEAYRRFVSLAMLARDLDFDEARIRQRSPFIVEDVMFNSVLIAADRAMARIARAIGEPVEVHDERVRRGISAMNEHLWSEADGLYLARDVRSGQRLGVRHLAGFLPLFAGVPNARRAERMLQELDSPGFAPSAEGWSVVGCDRREPGFNPQSYCRGPIWINLDWMLARGLEDASDRLHDERYRERAATIDAAARGLIEREGFREYFHAETGRGLGADRFSWSAALWLDLVARG